MAVNCTKSVMKQCKYSFVTTAGGGIVCDYITKTGHSRPCPPEACTCFEKKRKRRKKNEDGL